MEYIENEIGRVGASLGVVGGVGGDGGDIVEGDDDIALRISLTSIQKKISALQTQIYGLILPNKTQGISTRIG